jgi:hypothetical protein
MSRWNVCDEEKQLSSVPLIMIDVRTLVVWEAIKSEISKSDNQRSNSTNTTLAPRKRTFADDRLTKRGLRDLYRNR